MTDNRTVLMEVALLRCVFLVMDFLMPRWFAKRFLHPDIVAEYSYIFLWDEDLGVENFHPKRYCWLHLC